MFTLKNLSYKVGKTEILKNLTLEVGKSEIVALLGLNGSGKTTLIRSIFDLGKDKKRVQGEVTVDGHDISTLKYKDRAKLLSLMPQHLPTPSVTVEELVLFGREAYMGFASIPSQVDIDKTNQAITLMNLEDLRNRKVNTLSGGERQRAFFAMLLSSDTENIILDEPTSALDRKSSIMVLDFLKLAKSLGKSVLVVLHDLNEAYKVADHPVVLDNGNKIFDSTWQDFINSDIPKDIFLQKTCEIETENHEKEIFFYPI